MWHTVLFGGIAAIFLAMTAASLFHLRWARRLPSLSELKVVHEAKSRGNEASVAPCAETHGRSAKQPGGLCPSEPAPTAGARSSPPLEGPGVGSLPVPSIGAHETRSACSPAVLCSVVLPARDEESRIETTIRRLLAQEGVQLEVIVVDDRSQDRTREILRRLAQEDARVTVNRIEVLPEGWLGKCHACHLGAGAASGDWILFTDADCWLKPDVIRRALLVAEREGADHLTLTPGVAPET